MISATIIMVGICICTFLLSKAHIEITITHIHKDATNPKPEIAKLTITQEELDELLKKDPVPTFDEALKAVNETIGGLMNGE